MYMRSIFILNVHVLSLPPSLSLSLSDFKSSHFPVVTTLSKQLLSHAFKLLPNCWSQFSLPLFRVILCLCAPGEGEESVLCESDVSLLKIIVRNNQTSLEKLLQEKKQGLYILVYGLGHLSIFSVYFLYISVYLFVLLLYVHVHVIMFYSCVCQYILVHFSISLSLIRC